jgi:3-hydroxybutyryl-CoA dehydratase
MSLFSVAVVPAEKLDTSWIDMDKNMDVALSFEDIVPGKVWISSTRQITEADVVSFANLTGDKNPIHIDAEFASTTPYRQRIAHGLLGLSWVAGLGFESPRVQTVALLAVRNWDFHRPLYFGDRVHVRTTILEKQPDARRNGRVTWRMELINQQNVVVQSGMLETLVRLSQRIPKPHLSGDQANTGVPNRLASDTASNDHSS